MPYSTFRYRWEWVLDASPEALWPLVSDTNRFNRDTGLPPVDEVGQGTLENARRRLRFSQMGLTVAWEEQPFEWIRPWRFGVVRRYSRGPLEEMRVRVELDPADEEGTRLSYSVDARPSGPLGYLAIPLGIGLVSRLTFGRTFRRYAAEAGKGPDGPTPEPGAGLGRSAREILERMTAHGVAVETARFLATHLVRADDLSALRLRPYALADAWGLDRRETLVGFLRATRAGILDLRWDLLCPLCRGAKSSSATLEELRTRGIHCQTCRIDLEADLDRAVELTFTPNPAVRELEAPAFCVAGPQITPHVVVQQLLGPGESRTVSPRLDPGARYRIRSLDRDRHAPFRVAEAGEGEDRVEAVLDQEGWQPPDETLLAPEPEMTLENRLAEERLVVVERTAWADDAVTGAEVTALQEFRDLFSGEVLAAGEFLSVGSLAVLFTDLKDSTRMYRKMGDAPAFGAVMSHFQVLREAIEPEDGTVVKTIGDSVMAVFREPVGAVRAAIRAHRALQEAGRDTLYMTLKIGIHYGPCFAVRANDRLDYFGTTVNVAARLQDLSRGGDVVLSERVREEIGMEAILGPREGALEALDPEKHPLTGLDGALFRPWRLEVVSP